MISDSNAPNCGNVASVDVEDYYHVEAFSDIITRDSWPQYTSRVEDNTKRVLDSFDACGVRGTYFILGWVAERHPDLVRQIQQRGHEIACHSYWHRLIYKLSPEEFREDTRRAKAVIEDAAGVKVVGYRAPSFSMTRQCPWAAAILVEEGFTYDSSVFPVHHDVYGVADAPRHPFFLTTESGPLLEYPMTTFRIMGSGNLPVAGGGYLRLLPSWYTQIGVERARQEGLPILSYIHPWEFDPEQPRLPGRWKSRLRHYTNLDKTRDRLERLFRRQQFAGFRESGLSSSSRLETISL